MGATVEEPTGRPGTTILYDEFGVAHITGETREDMAFGAGWTPCIGPILGAILTYGFSQDTMWAGVGLLSVYSLGLAVPFLLAALALDQFLQTFKRFRHWIPVIEKASGVLLIFLGLLLLTGKFTVLATWLNRFTPAFILERI